MYREFYRFSQEPFDLQPDPKFLYLARSHYQALSAMMGGIQERKGGIVVTGEAGIGKTLLIYALLNDLSKKIRTAFVFNPPSDFAHLLKSIFQDLGVSFDGEEKDAHRLVLHFQKYLLERLPPDETVAVVLDEAQSLDERTMEDLGRLLALETPAVKRLQLILVGHPDLEFRLDSSKLRPLKKRIALRCRIRPLSRNEGRGYLKYRLKTAGRDFSEIFTPEAGNRVWEFAGGIPRVMNLLCSRALSIGCRNSSSVIDSAVVEEAIRDLSPLLREKPRRGPAAWAREKVKSKALRILFLLFSLLVFLLSIGLVLFFFLRK